MAGQPKTREKLREAEAASADQAERIQMIHINLAKRGLDPAEFDMGAMAEAPQLVDYEKDLPIKVLRLAGAGQSIEEIRETLGFTEVQEKAWRDSYVDFASACSRARAREEAFWLRQMRLAAGSGVLSTVSSIQSLISKRFQSDTALGNAADLVHVHIGRRLDEPVREDS